MELRYPSYYDTFSCIADRCPDSCCHQWSVVVDEASAERYRALDGTLGQALRKAMLNEDGDIILALNPDGRCPMWQTDGLCRIQAQLGEDALCDTCRQFPRLRHDYGNFVELGLELSCHEAARLILNCNTKGVSQSAPGGDDPDYDLQDMRILLHSREQALNLLEDDSLSIPEILTVLLLYGYSVQEKLDGGTAASLHPQQDLAAAHSFPLAPSGNILHFCGELNILTQRWRERLAHPQTGEWSQPYRALIRYFIDRYWLQAVSDSDLVSRIKLIIFSCLVIKTLGGDLCQTAQLFSKEIENDAENINAILDAAYIHPALSDANLLYLLLR